VDGVYLSGEGSPISYLYFDREGKRFKLHVSNGEDYITVDLSRRDEEYAHKTLEWIALIVEDF